MRAVGLQKGRESIKGELGVLVGQVRRLISIAAVKSQAECLISRMRGVGRGTAPANRRRQRVVQDERRWAREREAVAIGHMQGRSLIRRGQFML